MPDIWKHAQSSKQESYDSPNPLRTLKRKFLRTSGPFHAT